VTALYQLSATTWPPLVAIALLFGSAVFALAAATDADARAFAFLWRLLALLLLVASPFELLSATAGVAGTTMRDAVPLVREVLFGTHMGRLWLWRIPLTLALLVAAFMPLNAAARAISIQVLSAAILMVFALGSHAIDKGAFAVAVYTAHELAAALWLGSLAGFLLIATQPYSARGRVAGAAIRVSRIALWSVVVLVLTGSYNAWLQLGLNFHLLVDSLYGRMLYRKLLTIAAVLCFGAYNRWRLVPVAGAQASARQALVRNVAIEIALLLVVLGWTALLANSPPPH
jgi:copper transport protein